MKSARKAAFWDGFGTAILCVCALAAVVVVGSIIYNAIIEDIASRTASRAGCQTVISYPAVMRAFVARLLGDEP